MSKIYGVIPNDPVPDAPAAPVPDEVTAGYVSLSWDPVDRATLYQLYRDGSPLGGPTANTYATDSAVVPSTAYSYQLQAFNASGGSALSDALPVTTSANSLPEWGLTDQSGTIGAEFSLGLNTVCGDVDGHARTYTLVSGSVPGLSLTSPNYSGTPTTAGAYPLTFRASDGYGTSDVSITLNVYDPDVTAPTVPANVSASANGSTVTVTWDASTDATGVATYKIYRNGLYRASDTASPYEESGVPDGTYTYTVSAVDSSANANESAQSAGSAVTVSIAPSTPDTPVNFTAVSDGATTINLSWAAGPNGPVPDDYDLDFSTTSASGPWTSITFVGTAATYQHTGRTAGVTYYYRVRAGVGAAESGYAAASATAPISDTPDYVDPVASVVLNGGRVTVNVTSTATLQAAINAAVAGTTIQLAAGTYAGAVTVNKTFTAADALIIKGAANFASIATGTWTMTGARQIITGIDFDAATAKISVQGTNNKIIGNKFRRWTSNGVIKTSASVGYHDIEVAYNEIGPPGDPTGVVYRWGIKGQSGTAESSVSKRMWIHHNWFRDYNVNPSTGLAWSDTRGDAIEAGESGTVTYALTLDAGWYIEDNVATNAQLGGDALFDVKYGGCVVRRNTVDSASSNCKIQIRQGTSSILESNYLANGTIETSGRGHKIVGNYGTVRLLAGEDEYTSLSSLHHRSYQVLAAKNTGTLIVGYQYNAAYSLEADQTTIEEHTGTVTLAHDTNTVDTRSDPSSYQCTAAVQGTSADVGPDAITNASTAYKAARGLSTTPVTVAYTPGHYTAFEATRNGVDSTYSLANHTGIVGVQLRYLWRDLETALNTYDFSQVLTDLNNAQAVGKKVIVMIVDKTFSNNTVYANGAVPDYLASYTSPNPGGSAGALSLHRWRDYPRDRLIALIQAMAASEVNGHPALEAVATQETSISISDANLTTYGYTHQLYRDSYKSVLSAACVAFPTHRIFWYMNFIASTPSVGSGGQAMIGEVIDYMLAGGYSNFSFGGPDILPNSTTLNNLAYPYYDTYNGQVRMFCSNQFDSYESVKSSSPTVYHTMSEMLAWGVTNLHINYCMWNYLATADPVGSNDYADALVAIAATPTFGPA